MRFLSLQNSTEEYLQRAQQRLRVELALINGWRRGTAVEQTMDRLPRRADGALDREGDLSRHLDVLADEPEIGRALRNGRRPVGTSAREPDVVHVGQVARHADRRRHDRVELLVEPQLLQRLLQA